MPLIYFLLTLVVAIYLSRKQQNTLLPLLISFLLAVSLSYISSPAATFGDSFARVIFSTASMSSMSFLVHFLRNYFVLLQVKWPYTDKLTFMYSFPAIIFLLSMLAFFSPRVEDFVDVATILFFSNGLLNIFYILLRGYYSSKKLQFKILIASCIMPFLPYVFLYVLPEVLFQKPLLSAEIASLFFIFVLINFIFTQLTERLFGLQQQVSRLRYYGSFSLLTALLLTGLYAIISGNTFLINQLLLCFFVTSLVIYSLLNLKEKIDFKQRRLIPTLQGTTGQSLYIVIDRLGKARTADELLHVLLWELKTKLNFQQIEIHKNNKTIANPSTMTIIKLQQSYELYIGENADTQIYVTIGSKDQPIHLLYEEVIWLELTAMYSNIFFHNLKRIEELADEMTTQSNKIPWLQKLVWQFVEKEKALLVQELHDTILQEQLYIARELDTAVDELQLALIREQLLDVSYELREYCETLNPPLLDINLGTMNGVDLAAQFKACSPYATDNSLYRL